MLSFPEIGLYRIVHTIRLLGAKFTEHLVRLLFSAKTESLRHVKHDQALTTRQICNNSDFSAIMSKNICCQDTANNINVIIVDQIRN